MGLRLVAFDLDGVIHRGTELLPGADEALRHVLSRGLELRFVTNNSAQHHSAVAGRLRGFGLPANNEIVLTSGAATASWLRERLEVEAPVLVVGGDGLAQELRDVGFSVVHAETALAQAAGGVVAPPGSPESALAAAQVAHELAASPPGAVVVGIDRSFTYDTLTVAQAGVLAGAMFVATNTDSTFPAEGRLLPGGGSIVAAVATAGGRLPVVIGKPELEMAHRLAESSGVDAAEILFVGDRLDTDIRWANRAGMRSVLIFTGVTRAADVERARAEGKEEDLPDMVLDDLLGFPDLLDGLLG